MGWTPRPPRDRRGAHRLQRGPLQALLPGLLAVAAVGALVVAVLVMRGTSPSATVATTAPSSPRASAAPTSGSPSAVATPTSSSSASPADSGSASASPGDSASATASGEATATDGVKSSTLVVVLNQTRISGLAGQVAQTLRSAGWTVSGTGNFSGSVPATTVYYPDGMQAAAEALAADVPGPDRVRPRFGNLSKDKLTVIVTSAGG
ncbi:MAG: LytR C-terminal domain-containing protein [Motilibacteraceae bacterium]